MPLFWNAYSPPVFYYIPKNFVCVSSDYCYVHILSSSPIIYLKRMAEYAEQSEYPYLIVSVNEFNRMETYL